MTTGTAIMGIPATDSLRAGQGQGQAVRGAHLVGRWVGQAGGAVVRWCQAGQIGSGQSLEMARWSGARR